MTGLIAVVALIIFFMGLILLINKVDRDMAKAISEIDSEIIPAAKPSKFQVESYLIGEATLTLGNWNYFRELEGLHPLSRIDCTLVTWLWVYDMCKKYRDDFEDSEEGQGG